MGLRIKTNVESLVAQRQLSENRASMQNSLEKLASGKRINKSADDAAGLAVSDTMLAKIRSMGQAKRNANDGVSYLQVAEGGLSEISNMIVRMRELTTQASSDTNGVTERSFLNREFQELGKEITRITGETEFNGKKVLAFGDQTKDIAIQVGSGSRGGDIEPAEDDGIIRINLEQMSKVSENLGSLMNLNITGESGMELGDGSTNDIFKALDDSMTSIADFRATLGSIQSRMGSAITSIDVGMENLSAASSRIRDVDYAQETAKLTQARILSQAGTAVLTQANAMPETVMQLLRG